jgi:hypothetical protein
MKKLNNLKNCQDELKISNGLCKIRSNSVWGAIRGLETFSQLTYISDDNKVICIKYQIKVIISICFFN